MASSPDVAVSAADCRLSAFATVTDATRCWIKVPPLPALDLRILQCDLFGPKVDIESDLMISTALDLLSSSWPLDQDRP